MNHVIICHSQPFWVLADLIDTRRALRLELIVVVLIAFEIVVTFYQIYAARGH